MKRWLLALVTTVALFSIPVETASAQWGIRIYGGYYPYRSYYRAYRPYYYRPYRSYYYGYGYYPYQSYYYTPGWRYYYW